MILCINQLYCKSSPTLAIQHEKIINNTTIPLYSKNISSSSSSSSSSSKNKFSSSFLFHYYKYLFQTDNIYSFYDRANSAQLRVLESLWDTSSSFSSLFSSSLSSSVSSSVSVTGGGVNGGHSLLSTDSILSPSVYNCIITHLFPILLNEQHIHKKQQQQQQHSSSFSSSTFSSSSFSYGTKGRVVPLVSDRVSLPDSSLHTIDMISSLPDNLKSVYNDPNSLLLSSEQHHIRLLSMNKKIGKPTVNGDRDEYINLMKRMYGLGMIGTTTTPKAVNSVFTVEKDKDSDRLIIDAKQANTYFIDSPHVSLPTPSDLASLSIPKGYTIMSAKTDLSNYYHHIKIPYWISEYLALPSVTMRELGLADSNELVYPICLTLPMGWSHSVFVAQSIHEHILYKHNILNKYSNILNMITPDITQYPIHCIYIDDLVLLMAVPIGTTHCVLFESVFNSILFCYTYSGLVVKQSKMVRPTIGPITVLGVYISGTVICIEQSKLNSLIQETITCLCATTVTGHYLSTLIGSWCWVMLLNRPLLSILRYVYRYISIADQREFILWPCVQKELVQLIGLSSLLYIDLCSTFSSRLYATDASEQGAGVVSTFLSSSLSSRLWPLYYQQIQAIECEKERWIFPHRFVETKKKKKEYIYNKGQFTSNYYMLQPSCHKLAKWDNPISFQKILKDKCQWSYVINYKWKYIHQNIAQLEASSLLLALQHLSSLSHSSLSHRVFVLLDSAVLYYAIKKGRSSSSSLSLLVSSISSICIATGIRICPLWVPSKWNPADTPSRFFSQYE